jgi:hypothetical protein
MTTDKRIARSMTSAEFEAVRPFLNISDERIEAARAGLVLGESYKSIGERYGWSGQSAHDAAAAVWRVFLKYQESQRITQGDVPEGWEIVTMKAPRALIDKFRHELADFEQGR